MKPEDFQAQMEAAVKQYDRCIVSLGLAPRDFAASLVGMVERAINQFVQRAPGMRHGITVSQQVTVIISDYQGQVACNIYFNLHSDYWALTPPKGKPERESDGKNGKKGTD